MAHSLEHATLSSQDADVADGFDVFISYSRDDTAFAIALTKAIADYRPPKSLFSRRLRPFLDQNDLVGSEYYAAVDRNVRRARKLVVICSPAARSSGYVDDEIERFVKARGSRNIIAVLLSGTPNNEASSENDKAFPEALVRELGMPLAISFRDVRVQRRNSLRREPFASAWSSLVAQLLDRSRHEVEQRERQRAVRRWRWIAAFSILAATVLGALSVSALLGWREASQREQKALSRGLASRALLTLQNDPALLDVSLALAIEAARRYETEESFDALSRVLALVPKPTATFGIGHENRLAMEFDRGGAVILVAAESGLHRFESGESRYRVAASPVRLQAARFSQDRTTVTALGADGRLYRWRTSDLSPQPLAQRAYPHHRLSGISADGSRAVFLADREPVIRICETTVGACLREIRYGKLLPHKWALSPSGRWFASIDFNTVTVWSVGDGTSRRLSIEHHNPLAGGGVFGADVQFSPDETLLAAAADRAIAMFSTATWTEQRSLGHTDLVRTIEFGPSVSSPAVPFLASATFGQQVYAFSLRDDAVWATTTHAGSVERLRFAPAGRHVLSVSEDRTARVLELARDARSPSGQARPELARVVLDAEIQDAALSADGSRIASIRNGALHVATIGDGSVWSRLPTPYPVRQIAFDPASLELGVVQGYRTALLWPWQSPSLPQKLDNDHSRWDAIGIAPSGSRLALGDNSGHLALFERGTRVATLDIEGAAVALQFVDDDRIVAALAPVERSFPDGPTPKTPRIGLVIFSFPQQKAVGFVPTTHQVVALGDALWKDAVAAMEQDGRVSIWSVSGRNSSRELLPPVASSSDGGSSNGPPIGAVASSTRVGAVASAVGRQVIVVDAKSGLELGRWAHDRPVASVRFDPSGELLAIGGGNVVRVMRWREQTGMVRLESDSDVTAVAFSPSGEGLAIGAEKGVVVRPYRHAQLIDEGCRRASYNLNETMWREYIGNVDYEETCRGLPRLSDADVSSRPAAR